MEHSRAVVKPDGAILWPLVSRRSLDHPKTANLAVLSRVGIAGQPMGSDRALRGPVITLRALAAVPPVEG